MKKISFLFFTLLTVFAATAQTEFTLTPTEGINNMVEISVPGKSAAELYSLAKSWVLDKKEIHLSKTNEGLSLAFDGTEKGLVSIGGLGKTTFDGRYTIEMAFSEGKYAFYIMSLEYYNDAAAKWMDAALHKGKDFFNKKGELRSMYKYYPETLAYFNKLNTDLQMFIREGKK